MWPFPRLWFVPHRPTLACLNVCIIIIIIGVAVRVVGHWQLIVAYIALWCLFLKLETTTCGSMNSRFDANNDFPTANGHTIDVKRTLLVEFEC